MGAGWARHVTPAARLIDPGVHSGSAILRCTPRLMKGVVGNAGVAAKRDYGAVEHSRTRGFGPLHHSFRAVILQADTFHNEMPSCILK
jgi:hypothetical protein